MKVTPQGTAPSGASAKVSKTATTGGGADPGMIDGPAAGMPGEGENFASVLERVTQSHDKSAHQRQPGDDRDAEAGRDGGDDSSATIESKSWREDDTKDAGQSVFAERIAPREARPIGEAPNARAILHVTDLEKIVAACRTQVAAGGRYEVVIEMSRSVLEGLRVKVSADAAGRVTTVDFIAASENVRALLDARAAELSELLRARGVNLEVVKTSVAADANAQDDARDGRDSGAEWQAERVARAGRAGAAAVVAGEAPEAGRDDAGEGTTYRA